MTSGLKRLIRSRLCVGMLSLFFIALSVKVGPTKCSATEMEMTHKNLPRIHHILTWDHLSQHQLSSDNHCRCPASMDACCESAIQKGPKQTPVALQNRGTVSPFISLQAVFIRPSFYTPSRRMEMGLQDLFSSCQNEPPFLVNCTFLI